MRYLLIISLLFVNIGVFAQKQDTKSLLDAIHELDKALLNKDSVALKVLLSDDLSYGHSNGWIQSKRDVIDDLFNGKIIYRRISGEPQNERMDGNIALLRAITDVDVELNGKPVHLTLNVLQVWVWKNKHWMLFARQSVKTEK